MTDLSKRSPGNAKTPGKTSTTATPGHTPGFSASPAYTGSPGSPTGTPMGITPGGYSPSYSGSPGSPTGTPTGTPGLHKAATQKKGGYTPGYGGTPGMLNIDLTQLYTQDRAAIAAAMHDLARAFSHLAMALQATPGFTNTPGNRY